MSFSLNDTWHMRHALALGRRHLGQTWPNPSVGCVIAKDAHIIGRGVTSLGGNPHGEANALMQAGAAAQGACAYVTLEPCAFRSSAQNPTCSQSLINAGISRVVCALTDPHPNITGQGFAILQAAGVQVETGLLEVEAHHDHLGHILRLKQNRPFVQLKLALSADGYVASAPNLRTTISSPEAMARVHLARAMSDAIMVGIGTVLADDPQLTCRLHGMESRSPVRVVLDYGLNIALSSKLVQSAHTIPTWVIGGLNASADKERSLKACGVEVMRVEGEGRLDLKAALTLLAQRGITRVLSEGGPRIARALLEANLVDEMALLHAPMTIGAGGVSVFAGLSLNRVIEDFSLIQTDFYGPDRAEIYRKA